MSETALLAVGFIVAFGVGFLCSVLRVPSPAPPQFLGALIVLSITLGYLSAAYLF